MKHINISYETKKSIRGASLENNSRGGYLSSMLIDSTGYEAHIGIDSNHIHIDTFPLELTRGLMMYCSNTLYIV